MMWQPTHDRWRRDASARVRGAPPTAGGLLGMLLVLAALALPAGGAWADARSDYELGVAAHGRGDVIEALDLLQRAAEAGHVPAMVRLAYLLDKAEENDAAFRWYGKAAAAGDADAALGLGVMYANGEGVERDPAKALAWITRAAEAGSGPAMETLAHIYRRGEFGVPPDHERAVQWLERAAASGHEPARRTLDELRQAAAQGATK